MIYFPSELKEPDFTNKAKCYLTETQKVPRLLRDVFVLPRTVEYNGNIYSCDVPESISQNHLPAGNLTPEQLINVGVDPRTMEDQHGNHPFDDAAYALTRIAMESDLQSKIYKKKIMLPTLKSIQEGIYSEVAGVKQAIVFDEQIDVQISSTLPTSSGGSGNIVIPPPVATGFADEVPERRTWEVVDERKHPADALPHGDTPMTAVNFNYNPLAGFGKGPHLPVPAVPSEVLCTEETGRFQIPSDFLKDSFVHRDKGLTPTAIDTISREFAAANGVVVRGSDKYFFSPKTGEHKLKADVDILSKIAGCYPKEFREYGPPFCSQVLQRIGMMPHIHLEEDAAIPKSFDAGWVFRDFRVDFKTGEVLSRNGGDIFVPRALRANYVPGATCPVFDRFVKNVTGGDHLLTQALWQLVAYILSGDNRAKVFFFLVGVRNSGKSVFGNLLTHLIGTEHSFALSSPEQLPEKFFLHNFKDKILATSLDLPKAAISSRAAGIVKNITGHDQVSTEVKYKSGQSFYSETRFLFASNFDVSFSNEPEAERRKIIIPFAYSIPPAKQNPHLLELLLSEADGICLKAMGVYRELVASNYTFARPSVPSSAMVDPEKVLEAFVRQKIQFTGCWDDYLTSETLFAAFSAFYQVMVHQPPELKAPDFSRKFAARFACEADTRIPEGKCAKKKVENKWGFRGLRLASPADATT